MQADINGADEIRKAIESHCTELLVQRDVRIAESEKAYDGLERSWSESDENFRKKVEYVYLLERANHELSLIPTEVVLDHLETFKKLVVERDDARKQKSLMCGRWKDVDTANKAEIHRLTNERDAIQIEADQSKAEISSQAAESARLREIVGTVNRQVDDLIKQRDELVDQRSRARGEIEAQMIEITRLNETTSGVSVSMHQRIVGNLEKERRELEGKFGERGEELVKANRRNNELVNLMETIGEIVESAPGA